LSLCRCPALLLPPRATDLLDEPDVELMQNMSCKVDAATMKPAEYPENPEMEW
jgi:UTP--glucose-1-phosphate uridylyltransferase/phosphoglucomutase